MGLKDTLEDIKALKIQGAQKIALASVLAIRSFVEDSIFRDSDDLLNKLRRAKKSFFDTRPTEPCMRNSINYILDINYSSDFASLKEQIISRTKEAEKHLIESENKIKKLVDRKIKHGHVIFTHCHSSSVVSSLIYAHKKGKNIEVNNTEARPNFQGRITASELAKEGIKVNHFIDSAARHAIKNADFVLVGCDAVLSTGEIVNKIGTQQMAEIANRYNVPVYVCTDSWKFDPRTIEGYPEEIENRESKEVWPNHPKNIKIVNPVFEYVDPSLITGIISEFGIYPPSAFTEEARRENPWMFHEKILN